MAWIVVCGSLGWPPTKRIILAKAKQLATAKGLQFFTRNGLPGRSWWLAFRARNKQVIKMKRARKRTLAQADAATPENINSYFDALEAQIKTHGLTADRIFNLDETGIDRLAASGGQVAVSAEQRATQAICTDFRQHVSVVTCVCGDGSVIPPLFIFKGVEGLPPRKDWLKGSPEGSQYTQTGESSRRPASR